jgi:hypothetical protein
VLAPDLLREISLAVAGRWEPDRLFMLFTAYIDESDTHGPTPDMSMGAMLGSGRQWELFGRGLRGLQRSYGFKVLHAAHFKAREGEFSNWPLPKFRSLFDELGQLVEEHLTEAVSGTLKHDVYKQNFLGVRPQKMHATSQYGLLFLAILDALTVRVGEKGGNHRLSVGSKAVTRMRRIQPDYSRSGKPNTRRGELISSNLTHSPRKKKAPFSWSRI